MIHIGDCITTMKTLTPRSVQCCVTSPPYWGLRDYGVDGQLGSEETPALFVAKMVEVFQAVKRVIRDDGTLWLNLGDSYAASGPTGWEGKQHSNAGSSGAMYRKPSEGLKPKDLCGIPWRVAFALQEDGWYLRSDIIWAKPNPMPESVTDRPTKSHEYIFLLTKQPRYFYDAEAVREKYPQSTIDRMQYKHSKVGGTTASASVFTTKQNDERVYVEANLLGRNSRTVWTIPTQPFSKAHFATYPEKLVERCLKAGTSAKGCCPECGKCWVRVIEKDRQSTRPGNNNVNDPTAMANRDTGRHVTDVKTVGWKPDCDCHNYDDTKPIPCTVFDPFIGSGTTGVVAKQLGLDYIGIELNPEYAEMAEQRIANPYPAADIVDVAGQTKIFE